MLKRWVMPAMLVAGMLGSTLTAYAAAGSGVRLVGDTSTSTGERGVAAGAATVQVITTSTAGTMLADAAGRSLYLYTRDERMKSNCYGSCEQAWPPLITEGAPQAGSGVTAARLGTTGRTDGSMQVTYNGWPLYYFVRDEKPRDTRGQDVGNVWYVVSPDGGPRQTMATVKMMPSSLGSVLTDASGRALYLFTRDEPNKSNCSGTCALNWPPLLTIGPARADGVEGRMLGLITREDGSSQITYNSRPLYYYAADDKPGDLKGQNVGSVWYVLSPAGQSITAAIPAAPVAPAALPRTGDGVGSGLLGLSAVLGALLLAGGAWVRRRRVA